MDEIKGVCLSAYTETLIKVDEDHQITPWDSFDGWDVVGPWAQKYAEARFVYPEGSPLPPFNTIVKGMPLNTLARLSFDQLCKVRHSSLIALDSTVGNLFEKDSVEHMLFHKIETSIWRWGAGRSRWNDVVDAREGILSFDLDIEGFEVRLDHTTSYNECGRSEHSRTYLDGVFAYLVYHQGEHVMTLGFSIMSDRRVLIQQVQLAKPRGNRFLFRMPRNRLEHVVSRFEAAFPGHGLYVVDGGDVAGKSLTSYRKGLEAAQRDVGLYTRRVAQDADRETRAHVYLADAINAEKEYAGKVAHLTADFARLRDFYSRSGRYHQGTSLRVNGLNHYAVLA